jgi:hypothetical protein
MEACATAHYRAREPMKLGAFFDEYTDEFSRQQFAVDSRGTGLQRSCWRGGSDTLRDG